jgi:hypothetical protein
MAPENKDYNALREELIRTALTFSRKLTAFALLEELMDLQGMLCFSCEELVLSSDSDLLTKCNIILSKADEYLKDMAEYKIDETATSAFQSLINRMETMIVLPIAETV